MTSKATQILLEISSGDRSRADQLAECLYDDFRRLASSYLRDTKGNTLQPTLVVHEAFLKLVNQDVGWQGKSHFFAVGAVAMRQILVDHARRNAAKKRGGDRRRISLHENIAVSPRRDEDVLAVDEALIKLASIDERRARIVELRFYGGLTIEEVAEVLGVSRRTVQNHWAATAAWLRRELREAEKP